LAQTLNNFIQK